MPAFDMVLPWAVPDSIFSQKLEKRKGTNDSTSSFVARLRQIKKDSSRHSVSQLLRMRHLRRRKGAKSEDYAVGTLEQEHHPESFPLPCSTENLDSIEQHLAKVVTGSDAEADEEALGQTLRKEPASSAVPNSPKTNDAAADQEIVAQTPQNRPANGAWRRRRMVEQTTGVSDRMSLFTAMPPDPATTGHAPSRPQQHEQGFSISPERCIRVNIEPTSISSSPVAESINGHLPAPAAISPDSTRTSVGRPKSALQVQTVYHQPDDTCRERPKSAPAVQRESNLKPSALCSEKTKVAPLPPALPNHTKKESKEAPPILANDNAELRCLPRVCPSSGSCHQKMFQQQSKGNGSSGLQCLPMQASIPSHLATGVCLHERKQLPESETISKDDEEPTSPDVDLAKTCGNDSSISQSAALSDEFLFDRSTGEVLGIETVQEERGTLRVKVIKGGVVAVWNEANPGRELKVGDRILEINGVSGDCKKLVMESKKKQLLRVRIEVRGPKTSKKEEVKITQNEGESKKQEEEREAMQMKAEAEAAKIEQEAEAMQMKAEAEAKRIEQEAESKRKAEAESETFADSMVSEISVKTKEPKVEVAQELRDQQTPPRVDLAKTSDVKSELLSKPVAATNLISPSSGAMRLLAAMKRLEKKQEEEKTAQQAATNATQQITSTTTMNFPVANKNTATQPLVEKEKTESRNACEDKNPESPFQKERKEPGFDLDDMWNSIMSARYRVAQRAA